jgi:two-component system LytT family response regulator
VLIVDDEPLARRRLSRLLQAESGIEILGECGDGVTALIRIVDERPDLVFLDIQMPEMTGFEVLAHLPPDRLPGIIFVTAYDDYALRAFTVHALDYLLKPFEDSRFHQALTHARQRLLSGQTEGDSRLAALQRETAAAPRKRLLVNTEGQIRVLAVRDIRYVSAEDYCVRIHLGTGSCTLRRSLQQMHLDLGQDRFVRIHRSYLVPLERIKVLRLPMGARYQKEALNLLSR